MTKKLTLEQIQEANRKAIIMACNPTAKRYEEALRMELGAGCRVIDLVDSHIWRTPTKITLVYESYQETFEEGIFFDYFLHYRGDPLIRHERKDTLNPEKYKILGKPLTLDRVLMVLGCNNVNEEWGCKIKKDSADKTKKLYLLKDMGKSGVELIIWNLKRPTLEEQSESCQRAVYELLEGE